MLKINKQRQITAEFYVKNGDEEKLVKTTVINIDNEAVSTVYETLHEPAVYASNRKEMRKNEQELRDLRYKIEDEVLAELEASDPEQAE